MTITLCPGDRRICLASYQVVPKLTREKRGYLLMSKHLFVFPSSTFQHVPFTFYYEFFWYCSCFSYITQDILDVSNFSIILCFCVTSPLPEKKLSGMTWVTSQKLGAKTRHLLGPNSLLHINIHDCCEE